MRIVFPDGAGCVQDPADLEPLRRLGSVDFYDVVGGPVRAIPVLYASESDKDATKH